MIYRTRKAASTISVALICCAVTGYTQPVLDSGLGAASSADGLHPINPAFMASAWLKPGVALSKYNQVFFLPAVIQFRDFGDQNFEKRRFESNTEFPVNENLQARLIEQFGESFYEAISRDSHFELSTELGRNVIMVQGYLTDVVSGLALSVAGSNVDSIRWGYDANIILELRDGMSNEILARTTDHQRADGPLPAEAVYAATPTIAKGWGDLLVMRMRELVSFFPTRLQQMHEQSLQ